MIPRSVLLLIPFTMYLVCRTNGCGREVWRQTERQWLEEEWTDLTDMELYPNALDKFLTFIYSQPEYGQLQNDMLRLRVTLAEELMKTNLERRTGARAGIGSANRGTFDLVEIIELKKKMKSLQDLAPSP
ncbi:uncharacterized protein LOC129924594 isoform X2 [Biomphalaria glabrata]|uniref:Uncharacterized protein LOC129924594 isoform X2 n=1 Tax=Biomphalaria glabrata TaxID=6526 RepID=A0A9W2ZNA7_BIOGL|nr:uncharacterized protein LOC129924594 isoform X2 [Biomphalaria glabrata]